MPRVESLALDSDAESWRFMRSLPTRSSNLIDSTIKRFTNLLELELHGPFFGDGLFDHLRDPLPLESLTFGETATVSVAQLRQLLEPGPGKLSSLKKLVLDTLDGEEETTVVQHGGRVYRSEEDGSRRPYPDWQLPKWTESLSQEGFEALLELAEREGVVVEGSTCEALRVQRAHDAEVEYIASLGE